MEAGTLPKRADALRNRERVVAAAAEVFAERGVEATVPEVAARAGVGKATVYRSFPSKEHLVAAVANDRLTEFERSARERLDAPDAWEALVELFNEAAERYCRDRSLTGALFPAARSDLLAAARADVWRAVGELMGRAKAQGSMRPDATAADVRVLWAGVARMLASDGVDDPAEWRRYAALALGALRACG